MKQLEYLLNLTRFAFRENRLLHLSVAISLFSVAIELLAMSSLLPLFELVSTGKPSTDSLIAKSLSWAGIRVSAESLLWTFVALFAVRILTQLLGQSLSMYLGKCVLAQLSSRAFDEIVKRLSIREINERSIGFYISLAGDESFRASTLVIALTQFASTAVLALLYFAAIALYSPITAGFIVAFLLCSSLVLALVLRATHHLGGRQTAESRRAHSIFLDTLNNLKTIRSFSAERYVVTIYRSIIFGYTKILFLIDELTLLTRLVPILLLLVVCGAWLALTTHSIEGAGIAFIVTMIVYLMRFFPTVGQGVTLMMRIASDAKSGRDVTSIVGNEPASRTIPVRPLGNIERVDLGNICFSYDESKGKEVLKGVTLKFVRGKSYALTGKSGVGKSTLVDILLRFYLPSSGHLFLNELSIFSVADSDIRKRVIVVGQETAIFDDTVINNVCMGTEASLPEVRAACVSACIDDVIQEMPNEYHTRLQYQGRNLSGGQRQRLAIARGLLRKPDVLVLDESTNALDKETQEKVVSNILREYAEKIVIFVTHDPHIVRRVSEVVDLESINLRKLPLDPASKAVGLA